MLACDVVVPRGRPDVVRSVDGHGKGRNGRGGAAEIANVAVYERRLRHERGIATKGRVAVNGCAVGIIASSDSQNGVACNLPGDAKAGLEQVELGWSKTSRQVVVHGTKRLLSQERKAPQRIF